MTVPAPPQSGRYVAKERLGDGGTAEVWRAWDRHSERWCALKVLFKKYAEKRSARRRFIEEGRTVISLNHRNVIEAWDLVDDAMQPFLVMEIAEGGSLRDWVGRYGAMPPRLAVDAAIQISKGIGAAHKIGVVHRDIKPHNILLTRRGLCKVTDFGIAQIIREDGTTDVPDWTKTHHNTGGKIAGTRGYMAPEQRTNGLAADRRTDVYGIGATLYTLLTARVDTNLFAVDQDPSLMDGVHPELVPVIVQATKFRAEDRFQTVQELARALFDVRDLLPDVPEGSPGLAPELPPEMSGPLTMPPGPPSGSFSSLPPGVPPPPPPELAQQALEPGSASTPRRGSRSRTNLILSQAPDEVEMLEPSQRTRPLVVVAALVGILICGLLLDKLQVAGARNGCGQAHYALLELASRTSPVVDQQQGLEQLLDQLLDARNPRQPRQAVVAARNYLGGLDQLKKKPARVLGAIAQLNDHLTVLEEAHERWWSRSQVPGLAVTLGLEPRPPDPPPPRK